MRRLFTSLMVIATIALLPSLVLADNQETANKIAANLRDSGKMVDYKVSVKYQNGTTWLTGRVANEQQLNTALRLVFDSPGVNRVVNQLKVAQSARPALPAEPSVSHASGSTLQITKTTPIKPLSPAQRLTQLLGGQKKAEANRAARSDTQAAVRQVAATETVPAQPAPRPQPPPQFQPAPQFQQPPQFQPAPQRMVARPTGLPIPVAYTQPMRGAAGGQPIPAYVQGMGGGTAPVRYDQPHLPNYSWPSYASYPNYAALTYPRQYSPTAWPYIGPFYPYPQVPLGWRKVTLEWDDGWWMLDFKDR